MTDRSVRFVGAAAWGCAWVAGCALQLRQPALWSIGAYVAIALGDAAVAFAARRHAVVVAIAVGAAAFGATGWRAAERLADALPEALEGRDLVLVGVVAEMPHVGPAGTRFVFDVEQAALGGSAVQVP